MGLKRRKFSNLKIIDSIFKLEKEKIKKILRKKSLLAKLKKISILIGSNINNRYLIPKATVYKNKIKILDALLKVLSNQIFKMLITIPNIPYRKVPSKKDLLVYKNFNNLYYKKKLLSHWELGKKFNLFNFASSMTGSGFNIYLDKGAKLQRSLIQYCLDQNIKAGYIEYVLPFLVNKNSIFGTGQLPDKKINRLHQFDKVEIIEINSDKTSYKSFKTFYLL